MKDNNVIFLMSGILFSQIIAKSLKKFIKQSRPSISKTYGMPSSRATIISFIVFYLIFINKFKIKTKLIIIFIGLISLFMKYFIKEHSLIQLLCGIILGLLIAYLFYLISIKFD